MNQIMNNSTINSHPLVVAPEKSQSQDDERNKT
jgi:hypothetical protein